MLFIEGDVRFLVARGRDGLWLVYDSLISADPKNSYYGRVIVQSGIDNEQDAIETARNYEQEYERIRHDKDSGYLDSLLFY